MKVKTKNLIGPALDWAVATCEGMDYFHPDTGSAEPAYSTNWAQGGPIIERHIFRLEDYGGDGWQAEGLGGIRYWGPTPLIAAMRCFVASKLGDEVDVPDSLCEN